MLVGANSIRETRKSGVKSWLLSYFEARCDAVRCLPWPRGVLMPQQTAGNDRAIGAEKASRRYESSNPASGDIAAATAATMTVTSHTISVPSRRECILWCGGTACTDCADGRTRAVYHYEVTAVTKQRLQSSYQLHC